MFRRVGFFFLNTPKTNNCFINLGYFYKNRFIHKISFRNIFISLNDLQIRYWNQHNI